MLRRSLPADMADTIRVPRLSILVIALTLASVIASAQPPNGGGPSPVLGIVEIPEMFFVDPQTGRLEPRAALTLHTRPDSGSRVAAVIRSPEAIDTAEFAYEEPGALVYGRESDHFLIRTSRGLGWLPPHKAGSFHPLETLITSGLTYLTGAWDGLVSPSPGSLERTRVPPGGDDVRVKGLETAKGKLWVEIEVLSHSFCASNEPPAIRAQGWIMAHDAAGAPTVWFHSRGC